MVAVINAFTASAIALTRLASAAPLASPSNCPATAFNALRRLAPLNRSASFSALAMAAVRARGNPLPRTNWSRYERTTGNAADQTNFG